MIYLDQISVVLQTVAAAHYDDAMRLVRCATRNQPNRNLKPAPELLAQAVIDQSAGAHVSKLERIARGLEI